MKLISRILGAAFLGAVLSGCVAPADPSAMTPHGVAITKRFEKSVRLSVTGGQKTNPLWTSQVSNEDFISALQAAFDEHRLFSRVIRSGDADYQLDVRLVRLRQPMVALDMSVMAEVEWKLTLVKTNKVVWQDQIKSGYTASFGDAIAGTTRLRLANEGAIRQSIKAGMEKLSKLPL